MTDWLKELDRLEREVAESDFTKVGHPLGYYTLLWGHARELIDAAKEQNSYEEELREDRDAYAAAHKRAQHTVDNLKALLRRVRDSSKICPLKCTGICEIVEALND